jgi:hypothetical protein
MPEVFSNETLVLLGQENGITLIPAQTSLTSLNYFDGKFLRADDLKKEQDYLRQLVQFSNKAGGSGVVHGFNLQRLSDDRLQLSAGLAIDNEGRVLFMPAESKPIKISELITRSQRLMKVSTSGGKSAGFEECEIETAEQTATPVVGVTLYIIGISHAEALCGQEDVFGKMCEDACVTSTDRPYRREGVLLRVVPLTLNTPLVISSAVFLEQLHLRSRVASAYFQDESTGVAHLISKNGLASFTWCIGAAPSSGSFVPLAVIARSGDTTLFLDTWTARRERMDTPAKRYWQWRMHMRPWDVFIAQILQFQCQLRDSWTSETINDPDDPCTPLKKLVVEAADAMAQLEKYYQAASDQLVKQLSAASLSSPETTAAFSTEATSTLGGANTQIKALFQKFEKAKETITLLPVNRVLINRGIVELPSAGYLPVVPGSNLTVNQQIQNLLGEGVDLRFCIVRPDFGAHALEEAQHMERISLLKGLDDPANKEAVDILVPNGEILTQPGRTGKGWKVSLQARRAQTKKALPQTGTEPARPSPIAPVREAARVEYLPEYLPGRDFGVVATPGDAIGREPQQSVVEGAARSYVSPAGEAEFFFAGLAELDSQGDFVRKVLGSVDRESKLSLASMTKRYLAVTRQKERQTTTTTPTATPVSAPAAKPVVKGSEIAMRYQMLRAAAVDFQQKRLADTQLTEQFGGLAAELVEGNSVNHIAVWLGARCAKNPFTVAEGTSIDCFLDLTFLIPRLEKSVFLDLAINGRLRINRRISNASSGSDRLEASLTGNAILRTEMGQSPDNEAVQLQSVPVQLTSRRYLGEGNIEVKVDMSKVETRLLSGLATVQVFTQWFSAPLEAVRFSADLLGAEGEGFRFQGGLERNDDVLTVGHPVRNMSETAIAVLATREGSPNFAADATDDLFGKPPTEDENLVVLAREEWVLFHRRRNKQCGIATPEPVIATRRYQVYHVQPDNSELLAFARKAILNSSSEEIIKAGFVPVATVEFEGGRSSIATPRADLLADWQAAQPGESFDFGAIGSQGAAQSDGDTLARSRLLSLENAMCD